MHILHKFKLNYYFLPPPQFKVKQLREFFMKKIYFLFLAFLVKYNFSINFEIRKAYPYELFDILKLDHSVTYNFFKPLYQKAFTHLPLGQNPDYYLSLDLEKDAIDFYRCLNNMYGHKCMRIAYDKDNKIICGLIVFHLIKKTKMQIDLLMVDENYRGHGIGKALIKNMISEFKDLKKCIVYPVRFENEPTLKFYYSVGFKNLGVGAENLNVYGFKYSELYYKLELLVSISPIFFAK